MGDKKARKHLEKAQTSPHGWKREDLDSLYTMFGFKIVSHSKHDIVSHPDFSDLRATLTRSSGALHPAYVRHAVEMITALLERNKETITEE